MHSTKFFAFLAISVLLTAWQPPATAAADKLRVVTTLTDLADIAKRIGGDRVDVEAIARGYQDPHYVDAKPSILLKLRRADVFIQIGLDLESGWVPPLLEAARNSTIFYGGKGYLNASEGIELLEVPHGDPATLRAQGDIHVWGNPHYWLDPHNGKVIATNICNKFVALVPGEASLFKANLRAFHAAVDSADAVWQARLAPYKNTQIVAYHNSWPYFATHFHLRVAGFVEPKPGIPPTPAHLVSLIQTMQDRGIKVIIISPYFDDKPARSVASRVGAEVVPFAPSVGAFHDIESYFDLFDFNVNALVAAFKRMGVRTSSGE